MANQPFNNNREKPMNATSKMKVFVQTYGCQMNVYDSNKMVDVLRQSHQMEQTTDMNAADVILLNTCSVREKAEDKVYSELGRLREMKLENPKLIIGVGGCVASQEGKAILKRAPYVDLVFGPQTLHRLPEMLNEVNTSHKSVVDVSFPEIEKFDCLPAPRADGPTAFVSIMEGCSKYCSYCIVPYTRGEEISRPLDDVLLEISALEAQGVKEITLLGQNVNDYAGIMENGHKADLAFLIQLMGAMDGLERIRFTTSHPSAFGDNLIEAYRDIPKLANHLHLPVQSGSNRILKMMKRDYTVESYREKIAKLKEVRPNICVSTDIIVGFPGETEEDFIATMDLIHDIGFDNSFSFVYSPRPGTPAAKLHDNIPMEEKKRRLEILQNRITLQAAGISEKMVGTIELVLIDSKAKKQENFIAGRTENNRVVNLEGPEHLIGQMVPVKITAVNRNTLRGELCFD